MLQLLPLKNKENPGIAFLYCIEEYSNGIIPTSLLWQIVTKKNTIEIQANSKEKRKHSKLVKKILHLKLAQMIRGKNGKQVKKLFRFGIIEKLQE